ncbi:hypothetical protein J6590_003310 [Homalodisca vitripennis]|nr:hypothetical protein J6590_003310 [Homalodisca vitripennis]
MKTKQWPLEIGHTRILQRVWRLCLTTSEEKLNEVSTVPGSRSSVTRVLNHLPLNTGQEPRIYRNTSVRPSSASHHRAPPLHDWSTKWSVMICLAAVISSFCHLTDFQ